MMPSAQMSLRASPGGSTSYSHAWRCALGWWPTATVATSTSHECTTSRPSWRHSRSCSQACTPTAALAAPTDVVVRKNKVSNAELSGLHFGPKTTGLLADRNTALDNGLDCQDVSPAGTGTAGTSNSWLGNVGATDEPDGICGPPVDDPDDHGKGHGKQHKKKRKKHRPDPCPCVRHPKAI